MSKLIKVKMDISLDGIADVPEGTTAPEIFRDWCIQGILGFDAAMEGLKMKQQTRLQSIRTTLENVLKTGESVVEFEQKDFEFLKMCFDEGRTPGMANEVVMRVYERLEQAEGR